MKIKILIALFIGGAIFAMVTDDPPKEERTDSIASEEPEESEPEPEDDGPPEITDESVTMTEVQSEESEPVGDAHIEIEDDSVTVALVLKSTTSEADAKRLLENAARLLATTAAIDNPELSGAKGDDLGDLWDHYTLNVVAGTSADDVLVRGAKVKGGRKITW